MANLIGMAILALSTMALWRVRKHGWALQNVVAFRVIFVTVYAWALLLALRFGARTYPGIWIPQSELLNDIFNGGDIFLIGYYVVVIGALADFLAFHMERRTERGSEIGVRAASVARDFCLVLASLIASCGFYFAIIFKRLPG